MAKIKNFNELKKLEDTWHDENQINAIGIRSQMEDFLKDCEKNKIKHTKIRRFCVKSGRKLTITFFKKRDNHKIKKIARKYDKIVINANIVTVRMEL